MALSYCNLDPMQDFTRDFRLLMGTPSNGPMKLNVSLVDFSSIFYMNLFLVNQLYDTAKLI